MTPFVQRIRAQLVGGIRATGNAIVPELAARFVSAYMACIS